LPVLEILNVFDQNEARIYEDLKRGKVIKGITLLYSANQLKKYIRWVIIPGSSIIGFIGIVKIIKSEPGKVEFNFRPLKEVTVTPPRRDYKTGIQWTEYTVPEYNL
jgi:hypothetical protein